MAEETITQNYYLDYNLFTPIVQFNRALLDDDLRPGNYYRSFRIPGKSEVVISFMVPPSVRHYVSGKMYIRLNHCHPGGYGLLDITLNNTSYLSDYRPDPQDDFGVQTYEIPYSLLEMDEPNTFVIKLNPRSRTPYLLSDVAFAFEDTNHSHVYATSSHLKETPPGSIYWNIALNQDFYHQKPYLNFYQTTSLCRIAFREPIHFQNISEGTLTISLNHFTRAQPGDGGINMYLNNDVYLSHYTDIPRNDFGVQNFEIPISSLYRGEWNIFEIKVDYYNNRAGLISYWLSDVNLKFEAPVPQVTRQNYEEHVKSWILRNRKNFDELIAIPRDDLSLWEFIKNAPSWFYLPFLPVSLTELLVLISHFPSNFDSVGFRVQKLNQEARDFHMELLSTALHKKNAFRHAYWMALLTREFGAEFANALGNAHEYAHVDLTIEGPFDHVTDKINNAVGVELALNNPRADLAALVEGAWQSQELAWAKNFRVDETGHQTADVFWQMPLNTLARKYGVIPDFSATELNTLRRYYVTVPSTPAIHDEL